MTTLGDGGDLNNKLYRRGPFGTTIIGAANATRSGIIFQCPAGQKWMVANKGQVAAVNVPSSTGGTVLLDVIHRDASADTDTVLVNDFNLEDLTAKESSTLSLPVGYVLDAGDTLYASVISNNADATNLNDIKVEVELLRIQ